MKGLLSPIINSLSLISLMQDQAKHRSYEERSHKYRNVDIYTALGVKAPGDPLITQIIGYPCKYQNPELKYNIWKQYTVFGPMFNKHALCEIECSVANYRHQEAAVKLLKTTGPLIMHRIFINTHIWTCAHIFEMTSHLFTISLVK